MSEKFNAKQGLVIVPVQIFGPSGNAFARLAVDTGAMTTLIRPGVLSSVGYDLSAAPAHTRIVTASDVITVPRLLVERLIALDQERAYLPIIAHALPAATGVDGILGLDFYRVKRLTLNFRRGLISLA